MKRCNGCGEEVENHFSFCPVDGLPLLRSEEIRPQYRPTLISQQSLLARLFCEIRFLSERLREGWPLFKADPSGFCRDQLLRLARNVKRITQRPYLTAASASALTIVVSVIAMVLVFGGSRRASTSALDTDEDFGPVTTIEFRDDQNAPSKPGVGSG